MEWSVCRYMRSKEAFLHSIRLPRWQALEIFFSNKLIVVIRKGVRLINKGLRARYACL